VTGQTWLIIGASTVAAIGLGIFILTRTEWYRVRKYALDVKNIVEKYKVSEKVEAVQALGQNPNPVLVKKPLRELIQAYQEMLAALEKLTPPAKAMEVHQETLALHRESLSLYQMAMVGGFRQKAMQEKQKRLLQMERSLTEKMEKLYGPLKRPEKK
jgi:dephospho-CoA kinase